MMTKKKIQALIDDLMEDQNFYRKQIDSTAESAKKFGYIVHKYGDFVFLYGPGYETVGGSLQTSLDSCRGRIEGLQHAINELKKEL